MFAFCANIYMDFHVFGMDTPRFLVAGLENKQQGIQKKTKNVILGVAVAGNVEFLDFLMLLTAVHGNQT